MNIRMAHLRERSTSGGWINFAVFDAHATNGDNEGLLHELTFVARKNGLVIDQSALAFRSSGRLMFYGSNNLVSYLSRHGVPRWTHTVTV